MKIVFLDAATLGDASLESIAKYGELVCYKTSSVNEALLRVKDAEILIVNKVKVNIGLLDAAPSLKLVCEAATGVNNIDVEECKRRGIEVRNVAGYSTESVAQLAFAQILSLACRIPYYNAYVHSGSYSASGLFTDVSSPYLELSGKIFGIVGLGTIGGRVAKIATAFGMKVIYYSTSGTSHSSEYPCVSLDELLQQSDVISIHCPLNERTRNLIGEKELSMMKPTAVIANLARGGIINEAALADAIGNGRIFGAAVDTFEVEPLPSGHPYLSCSRPEKLLLTPHIGWASKEAIVRLVDGISNNIRDFISR